MAAISLSKMLVGRQDHGLHRKLGSFKEEGRAGSLQFKEPRLSALYQNHGMGGY